MYRAILLIMIFWLISLSGCGNDVGSPAGPFAVPESKDTFHGLWRGSMDGEVAFSMRQQDGDDLEMVDMSCTIEFQPFQFTLELMQSKGDTLTHYIQKGNWKWDTDEPESLVFLYDSTVVQHRVEERSYVRWSHTGRSMQEGSWTCGLVFKEGFRRLELYGINKDRVIGKWEEDNTIVLQKLM